MLKKIKKWLKLIEVLGLYGGLVFLLKSLTAGSLIEFPFHKIGTKIYLRKKSSDVDTFYQNIIYQQYRLKNIPFSPRVIIDAGANIGLSALYFSSQFPSGKIYALEPFKENYDLLVKNTKQHSQIVPLHTALWRESKSLAVSDAGGGFWGVQVRESELQQNEGIKSVSIESLMRQFNIDEIDILKMDIEGAEREVFSANYEYWLPRVKILIIELHDFIYRDSSKTVFKALCNYDFTLSIKGSENLIFSRYDVGRL